MNKYFNTPILLIIFNRPEKTMRVFEAIRKIKPARIFIAADGPREDREGEKNKCDKAREIIDHIDWPCELKTNLLDKNIGCDLRVSSAINWFFENVEAGIILEDDCLPEADFFRFCNELLGKYMTTNKIMMISGDNFQNSINRGPSSYYFSSYANTWGWATWKRAWKFYQEDLRDLDKFKKSKIIEKILPPRREQLYWLNFFNKLHSNKYSFWDAKWTFSIWNVGGISIVPNKNLVSNIGHDNEGTHTIDGSGVTGVIEPIDWPLFHPISLDVNTVADRYLFTSIYRVGIIKKVIKKIIHVYTQIKRKVKA